MVELVVAWHENNQLALEGWMRDSEPNRPGRGAVKIASQHSHIELREARGKRPVGLLPEMTVGDGVEVRLAILIRKPKQQETKASSDDALTPASRRRGF